VKPYVHIAAWSAAALLTILSAPVASAQPAPAPGKGPLACGQRMIPLQVGNYWVYSPIGSSVPDRISLKVVEVAPGKDKGTSQIKVEETFKSRTVTTVWRCSAAGLIIPPDSFYFAGEPGGGVDIALTTTSRDSVTFLPDDQLVADTPWIEILKADAIRAAVGGAKIEHAPAKIELERHCLVKGTEEHIGQLGQWNATKVTFELRGRAMVENEKMDIPIKRPGAVWLQRGLGVVKIDDAFERSWDLVESSFIAQKIP
jgi:hypothetical protein